MTDFTRKVALVTGGSRGIGAAIALRLARDGYDVVITYLEQADAAQGVILDITSVGGKSLALRADASDPATVRPVFRRIHGEFGRLDLLVNNAGYMDTSGAPLAKIPLEVVDRTLHVNIRGAFLFAQAAAAMLPEGGRIINIGSCVGHKVPSPGLSLYAASKAALRAMTQGLARDLAPRGITVNQISPGPVDTDMSPANGPNAPFFRELTAMKRFGRPADIAAAVSFLASAESAYITGAELAVDGGANA